MVVVTPLALTSLRSIAWPETVLVIVPLLTIEIVPAPLVTDLALIASSSLEIDPPLSTVTAIAVGALIETALALPVEREPVPVT